MAKLATLCKQRCSGTSIFSTFLYTFSYAFRVLESTQNAVLTSRNHRKYVLFTGLHVRRVQNEYSVLLSLFSRLPRHTYERTDQIIFDRFNMAAFSILDRHMAQLYAVGALSVVVIDIGDTVTDVTPIYEGFSLAGARATARVPHAPLRALSRSLPQQQHVRYRRPRRARHPPKGTPRRCSRSRSRCGRPVVRVPVDGIAVREAEDEDVIDIAAVLVAGKEKAVFESGMKRRAADQARAKGIEALDLASSSAGKSLEVTLGKKTPSVLRPLCSTGSSRPTSMSAQRRMECR